MLIILAISQNSFLHWCNINISIVYNCVPFPQRLQELRLAKFILAHLEKREGKINGPLFNCNISESWFREMKQEGRDRECEFVIAELRTASRGRPSRRHWRHADSRRRLCHPSRRPSDRCRAFALATPDPTSSVSCFAARILCLTSQRSARSGERCITIRSTLSHLAAIAVDRYRDYCIPRYNTSRSSLSSGSAYGKWY